MSWLLVAAIAIVALVATIAMMGAQLPVAHVAASRARYAADIDAVWSALEAEIAGTDMNVEIVEREAPRRLVTRIPPGGPFGGTWRVELAPENGTVLSITEYGEVYNVIFRFLSHFVLGHHGTQEQILRAVGKRLQVTTIPERLPPPA